MLFMAKHDALQTPHTDVTGLAPAGEVGGKSSSEIKSTSPGLSQVQMDLHNAAQADAPARAGTALNTHYDVQRGVPWKSSAKDIELPHEGPKGKAK